MTFFRIILLFCFLTQVHAGIPVWSFAPDPNFPPNTSVNIGSTATVRYLVTNNSLKNHRLALKPQRGVRQEGACILGPRGSSTASCELTLTIIGSEIPPTGLFGGPILCQANSNGSPNINECYQPSLGDTLAINVLSAAPFLTASLADLALSITGLTLDGLPSGQSRVFTITNTGNAPAVNLSISATPFPAGTTIDTAPVTSCIDGSTLNIGDSCTITIAPGNTPSSGAGNVPCTTGIAPIPTIVSATAIGTNQTATNVVVLSYACIYQGGLIYAMSETANDQQSIGGQVTSLVDQAEPSIGSGSQPSSIIWASNGTQGNVSKDVMPTISENFGFPTYPTAAFIYGNTYNNEGTFPYPPSSAFDACDGSIEGACNSHNILAFYNTYITNYGGSYNVQPGITPLTYYSTGLCTASINGFNDWYLPAICQLDAVNGGVVCPVGAQSIVGSLGFLIGDPNSVVPIPSQSCNQPFGPPPGVNCFAGIYWSSTLRFFEIVDNAYAEVFDNILTSIQDDFDKAALLGVRCSRNLTI